MCETTARLDEGLHARPAALAASAASGFSSRVTVRLGESVADASSVISMMALGAGAGAIVTVTAEGEDEKDAAAAVARALGGSGAI